MAALVFAILLCLGWLVPEHFPPWLAFHGEAPAFAGLVAAFTLVWWKSRDTRYWNFGPGQLILAALVAVAALQYLWGQLEFAGDLWLTCAYIGGLLFAWTMGRHWATEPKTTQFDAVETLALGFALGATVSALMAITQALGQEEVWGRLLMSAKHIPRALANLGQPNQLATLLLMGVVATVLLRERELISRNLTLTLVLLLSVAVLLAQSRTAMLSVTALALWGWWHARTTQHMNRKALLIWLVLMWGGSWLYQWSATVLYQAVSVSEFERPNLRFVMWQQLLAAIAESPWLGYGWLQTPLAQQVGALKVAGVEQVLYAHNHLLDLATWLGLPLALMLAAVVALAAWRRRRSLQQARVLFLLAWLLPVAIHALLEFPLAYAYFLLPVGVLMGILDKWTQPDQSAHIALPRHGVLLALLLYSAMLFAITRDYLLVEEDFRVARFESRHIGQTPADYQVPEIHVLTHLGTVLKAMRVRTEPGMKATDIELLRDASRRFAWAPLHFRYALALGLHGQPDAAAQQMTLIKGLFGDEMYTEAAADFRRLQQERYPVLSVVKIP